MTQIFKLSLVINPLQNVILPTPSSKVIKYLILSNQFLPSLKPLLISRDKYKPVFVSNLGVNGERIIDRGRGVKSDTPLKAFISFSGLNPSILFSEADRGGNFKTPYGEFYLSVNNIEIVDVKGLEESIERSLKKNINIAFKSPALLSSKLLLPPSLKEKFKNVDVGLSTLPSVGLVAAHAYKMYCNVIGKREIESNAFKLGVMANALSRVIGYNLRPVTIEIGEDEKGNPRKTRGVVGWVEFDIPYVKLKRAVIKYLIIASYLGIGRSRGIGLGEIEVNFVSVSQ